MVDEPEVDQPKFSRPAPSGPAASQPAATGVWVPSEITLFGFDPVRINARIEARGVGWRIRRTALALVAGLLVAPVVGLVPPHAPWAVGALGIGFVMAGRRWAERHTLHSFAGTCPRCSERVSLSRPVRLRRPHPIPCPSCHYELAVSVDL